METQVLLDYKQFAFLMKNKKSFNSSTSDYWKYTKSCFKEHARTFFKNGKLRWHHP